VIGTALETALENAYIQLSNTLAPGQAEKIEALLVIATPPEGDDANDGPWSRSRLELFKAMPRKESPEALLALLDRLSQIGSLGLSGLSALTEVHPATRRMLANWGYRYKVWKLRRFASAKRIAIVLCFLHAARAEATDAIVEIQDKLITAVHSKARQRYEDLLRATEEARSRAVEILEELGTVVLDIPFPIANFARQFLRGFQVTTSASLSRGAALCGLVMKDHTWGWSTTGTGTLASIRRCSSRGLHSSSPNNPQLDERSST
jgi:hypothetical protein